MLTSAARRFDAILFQLNRKPVVTAMMVWSLVFGISALIAGITVWRVSSACEIVQLEPRNGAQGLANVVRHDEFRVQQALQAGLHMRAERKDSAEACPCAASSKWHWQPI
jgi:hypothetical protein